MILALLFACAGVLDLGRATPLAPGEARFRVGTASGGLGLTTAVTGARFAASGHAGVVPGVEIGGGLGAVVVPNFGLGSVWVPDGMVEAKLALGRRSPSGFHSALNPRVRVAGFAEFGGQLDAAVLLGWDVGAGQVVLAPRAALVVLGSSRVAPAAGLALGWVLPAGGQLEVVPGFGVEWMPAAEGASEALAAGAWNAAAGVSFVVAVE